MTPPLGKKQRGTKELLMKMKEESEKKKKNWLKTHHSEN